MRRGQNRRFFGDAKKRDTVLYTASCVGLGLELRAETLTPVDRSSLRAEVLLDVLDRHVDQLPAEVGRRLADRGAQHLAALAPAVAVAAVRHDLQGHLVGGGLYGRLTGLPGHRSGTSLPRANISILVPRSPLELEATTDADEVKTSHVSQNEKDDGDSEDPGDQIYYIVHF